MNKGYMHLLLTFGIVSFKISMTMNMIENFIRDYVANFLLLNRSKKNNNFYLADFICIKVVNQDIGMHNRFISL